MKPHPSRPLAALMSLGFLGLPLAVREALATPTFEAIQSLVVGPQKPSTVLLRDAAGNLFGVSDGGGEGGGTIYKVAPDGTVTTLHSFDASGWGSTGLTAGPDGNYYGTTGSSAQGRGTVFRITPAGVYTVIHVFQGGAGGGFPVSRLLLGNDGNFYGTTNEGGAHDLGTLYRITPAGVVTTLVSWGQDAIGWQSYGQLIQDAAGNLYGTTTDNQVAGENKCGCVYRVTPGGQVTALANFDALPGMAGASPRGVTLGSDGNFYGVTPYGGINGGGTAFKLTPSGELTLLKEFGWPGASEPFGTLVEGQDGAFYGTAKSGVAGGEYFKITTTGDYTTLAYPGVWAGEAPQDGFTLGSDGDFYVATLGGGPLGGGTVMRMTSWGECTVLANFDANPDTYVDSPLVQAPDGGFFGATLDGGAGYGSIFHMDPYGQISRFSAFTSGFQDYYTARNLMMGSNGRLYGVHPEGGLFQTGSIYSVNGAGVMSEIKTFDGDSGGFPTGMVEGSDGNFYGTSGFGAMYQGGSVFRMTPSGSFSYIAGFDGSGSSEPQSSMIQATDGNFYGVAASSSAPNDGAGTVFKLTPSGVVSTFASFSSESGAARWPKTSLTQGSDGSFYGVASGGGAQDRGAVYKVTPGGTVVTLANFDDVQNGRFPVGTLVEGPDGAFYGACTYGGGDDLGSIYRVTSSGQKTLVHEFVGSSQGNTPLAGLVKGPDGNLYGSASQGGTTLDGRPAGGGQIFRIRFGAEVATDAASEIGIFSGKLNATVNPGGYSTAVTFQYGTSPALETPATVSGGTLPAGTTPVTASASLSGLAPETTYYFRAVGVNAETPVPQSGEVRSFTTAAVIPAQVATLPASGITLTTASLNATSTPGTYSAAVSFEYGTSPTLEGCTTVGAGSVPADASATLAQAALTGLTPGTTYYYRAVSASSENQATLKGEILSFTIIAVTPALVLTEAATGVSLTGATLNGSVTPGTYAATVGFEYGTSPTLEGSSTVSVGTLPAGPLATEAHSPLTGLAPGTTYYFRATSVSAVNGAVQLGGIQSFTTDAVISAMVVSQAATGVTLNGATLNGTVTPGTYAATVSFEYGTSPTLEGSSTVSAGSIPAETVATATQATLSGLAPGTTYYYRVTTVSAVNGAVQSGSILSFATAPVIQSAVTTQAATSITTSGATLNGTVTGGTYAATVSFEYGTSPTLASSTTVSAGVVPANASATAVQATLTGLVQSTTYYYRVVSTSGASQAGEILSFTTSTATPPSTGSGRLKVFASGCHALDNGDAVSYDTTTTGASESFTLTLRNTSSSSALTGVAASISGKDASQFSVTTAPAQTVAAGGTTTVVVRFAPTSNGNKKATLTIVSSDPTASPFKIQLSGIGRPPQAGGRR